MILAILKFLKEQWSCCCIFWCSQRSQLATLNVQKVLKFYSNKEDFDSSSSPSSLNDAKENWVNEASNSSPLHSSPHFSNS